MKFSMFLSQRNQLTRVGSRVCAIARFITCYSAVPVYGLHTVAHMDTTRLFPRLYTPDGNTDRYHELWIWVNCHTMQLPYLFCFCFSSIRSRSSSSSNNSRRPKVTYYVPFLVLLRYYFNHR